MMKFKWYKINPHDESTVLEFYYSNDAINERPLTVKKFWKSKKIFKKLEIKIFYSQKANSTQRLVTVKSSHASHASPT